MGVDNLGMDAGIAGTPFEERLAIVLAIFPSVTRSAHRRVCVWTPL